VTAIGDRTIAEVVELVRPLVPHDNESGFRWLLPEYLTTAEVLRGLGIVAGDTATYSFADGTDAVLEPVDAGEVASTLGGAPAPLPTEHDPVWLRELATDQWLTTLEGGKVVYFGYRLTTGPTTTPRNVSSRWHASPAFGASSSTCGSTTVATIRPTARCSTSSRGPSWSASSSSSPGVRPFRRRATSSPRSIAPRAPASSASPQEAHPASGATRSRSCSNGLG
jgi:hypothetical protein